MKTPRRFFLGLAVSIAGALIAKLLYFPLPWLLGPLLGTAITRMSGVDSFCPKRVRYAGQWVIGVSIGLYFTPEVAHYVVDHSLLIAIGVIYALLLGALGSLLLQRYANLDFTSAWFAAAIGGASEMTTQAERRGAQSDRVATVHSLRVLLVVVIIPFSFQWLMGAQAGARA